MQPTDDSALLRQFAADQSEEAFAALVNRYIHLVYSVALRQTGHPQNAGEVTQAVFIILARKAAGLRHEKALSSWLFQTTRLTANNLIRSETRRHHREQEAYMQSALNEPQNDFWPHIAPLLDHAVATLREKDRQAILLRFYEGKNLRDIGNTLGVTEDTAQKRVNRALEKLQTFFARHGVSSTAAAIGESISTHSIQLAPATLAKSVTTLAIAKGASASVSTLTLVKGALNIMTWTKTSTAVVTGAILILGVGTTTAIMHRSSSHPMGRHPGSTNTPITGGNMNRANWGKQWALAIYLYSDSHQNQLPTNLDELLPSMPKQGPADEKNWELLLHGKLQGIPNPAQTVLLREKEPRETPEGKYTRAYAFADGHVEIASSPDLDFTAVEKNRGFLVESP